MKKTIIIDLKDLKTYSGDESVLLEIAEALKNGCEGSSYRPCAAGILCQGKSGHCESEFKHKDLFSRFSQASPLAQGVFLERVHNFLDREKLPFFIEVEWSLAGRKRMIQVSSSRYQPYPGNMVFELT